jgi:Na+/melibiose symporter-like transporter
MIFPKSTFCNFYYFLGGYEGDAVSQSQSALNAITITFTWWYSLGSIACIIILFFLRRLDKQMPRIRVDLEARRIETAS